MATLYEIDQAIEQAILECVNPETGEIEDFGILEALQMERDTKVENVSLWYKNCLAEAAAIKAERDALNERLKSKESKAESLKRWLSNALFGQVFETPRVRISWRKSEGVVITDESKIPEEYTEKVVTVKPLKTEIKEALKAGTEVSGAYLEKRENIQIK